MDEKVYPKWKYKKHDEKPFHSKLVHSEEQEESLGVDWHESPHWHESSPSKKVVSENDEAFEFPVVEPKKRGRPAKAKE